MKTLGSRLKEAREKKRLTQADVAKKLGISHGTLSGYERDYRDPDTQTLIKLSQLYEVSIDYLLGRTDNPKIEFTELERLLIDRIDLDTDDELIEKIPMNYKGKEVTVQEKKEFLAIFRALLDAKKDKSNKH